MDIHVHSLLFVIITCILFLHGTTGSLPGDYNYKPTFTDGLPELVTITAQLGKHIRMLCKVDANPASFTEWNKEENNLLSSNRIRIFKKFMLIKKAIAEDAGEYHCKVANPFGTIARRFVVKIPLQLEAEETHAAETHANCAMVPNSNLPQQGLITGNIHMRQKHSGPVEIDINLEGLFMTEDEDSHTHGIHIHEFGDLSNSCDSVGNIYRTDAMKVNSHHSNRNSIMCDDNGEVHVRYSDNTLMLHGKHSVIGRSFVIHDGLNGRPIACCVIGRSKVKIDAEDTEDIHVKEELLEYHGKNDMEPVKMNH